MEEYIKKVIAHLEAKYGTKEEIKLKYKDLQHQKELAVAKTEYAIAAKLKEEQEKIERYFTCIDVLSGEIED